MFHGFGVQRWLFNMLFSLQSFFWFSLRNPSDRQETNTSSTAWRPICAKRFNWKTKWTSSRKMTLFRWQWWTIFCAEGASFEYVSQKPKGRLVKGPYQPICRDCAIYFSVTMYVFVFIFFSHVFCSCGVFLQRRWVSARCLNIHMTPHKTFVRLPRGPFFSAKNLLWHESCRRSLAAPGRTRVDSPMKVQRLGHWIGWATQVGMSFPPFRWLRWRLL